MVLTVAGACGKSSGGKQPSGTTTTLVGSKVCKSDEKFDEGNTHVANGTDVTYSVNPPAGGTHWVSPAPNGIYDKTQIPPTPPVVHALEHGYVAVWWRVGLAQSDVDHIEVLGRELKPDVLVVPQQTLSVPIAATAWHHRLLCTAVDLTTIKRFVETWRNKGPERVPHQ